MKLKTVEEYYRYYKDASVESLDIAAKAIIKLILDDYKSDIAELQGVYERTLDKLGKTEQELEAANKRIAELKAELNDKGLWEQVVQSNKDVVGPNATEFAVNELKNLADKLQLANQVLLAELNDKMPQMICKEELEKDVTVLAHEVAKRFTVFSPDERYLTDDEMLISTVSFKKGAMYVYELLSKNNKLKPPKWTTPCSCKPDDRTGETWCCNNCGRPTQSSEPCPWWAKLKKYDRFISDTGSVTYFTGAIKIYSDGAVFIGGAGDRLLENEVYFGATYCRPYTGPTIEEIKAKLTEDEWQVLEQAIKEGKP